MSIELKIKSKHLALEPAIIRKEERNLLKQIQWYKMKHQISTEGTVWTDFYKHHPDLSNLYSKHGRLISHRRIEIREESRATYLARAYIKDMPYKTVEVNGKGLLSPAVMKSMIRMVMRYGSVVYRPDYERSEHGMKVAKTAEDKAKEDILKWLEQ